MNKVKLNERDQKNIKFLSKILFLIGKISKIITRVAIGFIVFTMIMLPIIICQIDIKDNNIVSSGNIISITELKDGVKLSLNGSDNVVISDINIKDISDLKTIYNKYSKSVLITLVEAGFIFLVGFLLLLSFVFNNLEKLFNNIYYNDTPFTLENVNHIKKMAYLMIICIILSNISLTIFNVIYTTNNVFEFNLFNILEIIFLYALSYIFEYGYYIQINSKEKMYELDNKS